MISSVLYRCEKMHIVLFDHTNSTEHKNSRFVIKERNRKQKNTSHVKHGKQNRNSETETGNRNRNTHLLAELHESYNHAMIRIHEPYRNDEPDEPDGHQAPDINDRQTNDAIHQRSFQTSFTGGLLYFWQRLAWFSYTECRQTPPRSTNLITFLNLINHYIIRSLFMSFFLRIFFYCFLHQRSFQTSFTGGLLYFWQA